KTTEFGPGRIHEVRSGSAVVLLSDIGIMVNVPLDDLEIVKSPTSGTKNNRTTENEEKTSSDTSRGLDVRCVEALRFGIVPPDGSDRLTIGYEGLKKWVLERL